MSSHPDTPRLCNLNEVFASFSKQTLEDEVAKLKSAVESHDTQQVIMSIPLLLALTICPAMLGTQEAIRQSQSKTKREEHRGSRCNLVVSCVKPSIRSRDINGKLIVLKDSKLYIAGEPTFDQDPLRSVNNGYPFSGYFLPYPDSQYEGLVSTISDDPPMLNWVYVDKNTHEVKYGVRAEAQDNLTGPFDCTQQDRRMTLEGWEGFVAVEEFPGTWALYFDRNDDGLAGKISMGTRVLEVELVRREKKGCKPNPDPNGPPRTLDEKMKQHKEDTQRQEDERQEFYSSQAESPLHAAQPGHPPTPHNTSINERRSPSQGMQRLSPGRPTDAATTLIDAESHAPSVVTNDVSTWSDAGRHGEVDGDELATTASSVLDAAGTAPEASAHAYQKPYVQDASKEEQLD